MWLIKYLRQLAPRRLWDSEFASVAMWIHFASYRVGMSLHHWSEAPATSLPTKRHTKWTLTGPSCWRLSGSCNSMITQLFRSWWHKSSCSIGKPSQKKNLNKSSRLYLYTSHFVFLVIIQQKTISYIFEKTRANGKQSKICLTAIHPPDWSQELSTRLSLLEGLLLADPTNAADWKEAGILSVYVYNISCMYIYIYTYRYDMYIERKRERERDALV